MFHATCLAMALREELHEPLQKVESSSTFCNDFSGVKLQSVTPTSPVPLGDCLRMRKPLQAFVVNFARQVA